MDIFRRAVRWDCDISPILFDGFVMVACHALDKEVWELDQR